MNFGNFHLRYTRAISIDDSPEEDPCLLRNPLALGLATSSSAKTGRHLVPYPPRSGAYL